MKVAMTLSLVAHITACGVPMGGRGEHEPSKSDASPLTEEGDTAGGGAKTAAAPTNPNATSTVFFAYSKIRDSGHLDPVSCFEFHDLPVSMGQKFLSDVCNSNYGYRCDKGFGNCIGSAFNMSCVFASDADLGVPSTYHVRREFLPDETYTDFVRDTCVGRGGEVVFGNSAGYAKNGTAVVL